MSRAFHVFIIAHLVLFMGCGYKTDPFYKPKASDARAVDSDVEHLDKNTDSLIRKKADIEDVKTNTIEQEELGN